jgi:CheY-like chemotaxis protein
VLVVEDEVLVSFMLQDLLAEMGCTVVASAMHIDDALAKARTLDVDVAVLDANLAGHPVDPVADLLAQRDIPFLFATGYGVASLPAGHRTRLALTKPYSGDDLRRALSECLAGRRE